MYNQSDEFKIYAAIDPRSNLVRYIGYTGRPLNWREVGHEFNAIHQGSLPVNKWVDELMGDGRMPQFMVLDSAPTKFEALHLEHYWIIQYAKQYGVPLENIQYLKPPTIKQILTTEATKATKDVVVKEKNNIDGYKYTKHIANNTEHILKIADANLNDFTVSEAAKVLECSRNWAQVIMNSLLEKGYLKRTKVPAKSENGAFKRHYYIYAPVAEKIAELR